MFCKECGKELNDNAVVCVNCGCACTPANQTCPKKDRIIALVLWFFFAGFGIHRFYLGQNTQGMLLILNTILLAFFFWLIIPIFFTLGVLIFELVKIIQNKDLC